MELAGRRVLITGASRGLGRALAVAFARTGARLALVGRDRASLEETARLCRAQPPKPPAVMTQAEPVLIVADLAQLEENQRMVAEAVQGLGGLDVFVANAGQSMWADFADVENMDLYARLISINYLAVVYGVHAALPHLEESGGWIVSISSAQAWTGMPHHTGYAASKAALQAFLDSLSMEVGNRVRVLGVYPGWIRGTDLRMSALGADGEALGDLRRTHNRLSVSAEDCSEKVVRALQRERSSIFVPGYLRLLQMARPFAFPVIRRILGGAVRSQRGEDKSHN